MEMINTYDEGDVDYSVVSVVWLTIDLMYVELSSLYFFKVKVDLLETIDYKLVQVGKLCSVLISSWLKT